MESKGYSLVLICGEGDPLAASALALIAALIALDCHPLPDSPFKTTLEPAEHSEEIRQDYVWAFSPNSTCGRYETDKVRKWWNDAKWLADNPQHPVALIRAAFHCSGLVPLADPPPPDAEPLTLRAALYVAGVNEFLHPLARFRVIAERRGPLPAQFLDRAYRAANRSHTLRVVGDAFAVFEQLKAEVAKAVPLLRIRKGSRSVSIPIDASPEEEAALLDLLDNPPRR